VTSRPGGRRASRERALSLLYEAESKSCSPGELLTVLPVAPDAYAAEVVQGVGDHQEAIDGLISEYARDWTIDRMPAIDRNLLRLAVYELQHRADVPLGVVISEAVELAQVYSTDESGRFVNGMLSRIAEMVRPAESAQAAEGRPGRPGHGHAEPH
jgi:N utilization substance protein B